MRRVRRIQVVTFDKDDEQAILDRLRIAQLTIAVLREKRRMAKAGFEALRRYGRHEEGCETEDEDDLGKPLPCNCGFKQCKREWRLAMLGKD